MIDVEEIKKQVDCREVVTKFLGKPKAHSTKYDAYKCPFHREKKGVALTVYADGWICRGACNTGGSAIEFLLKYQVCDTWQEACQWLVREFGLPEKLLDEKKKSRRLTPSRIIRESAPEKESEAEPPSPEWQSFACRAVEVAQVMLWSDEGKQALDYLRNQRGLDDEIIKIARLGYVLGRTKNEYAYGRVLFEDWSYQDKNGQTKPYRVPCGITIPHFADGHLWAVRVRRPLNILAHLGIDDNNKYLGIREGRKALYWYSAVRPFSPVLIDEGEFNCLILEQCAGDIISPLALCSASNKSINPRWFPKLLEAPMILVRIDDDGAGKKAMSQLSTMFHSNRLRPVRVPLAKDPNDFYLATGDCGEESIRFWLRMTLAQVRGS